MPTIARTHRLTPLSPQAAPPVARRLGFLLPPADCRVPSVHRRRPPRGVTLIELIMVLVITSIALAVGVIRLGRLSVFMTQGERAAHVLVADLRFAQSEAITQAKNHYLLFTSSGSQYTSYAIYRVETGGDVLVEPPRILPASVALTGSQARAEFRPGGDAVASYTYTVTSPGHSYQIGVVLVTGGVSIQGS